jgi:hypothetical protein
VWAAAYDMGLFCCFIIPFLVVWGTVLGRYLNFVWYAVPSALERWAKDGGCRIVRRERRNFFRGPFSWTLGKYQVIYRVEVLDQDGPAKRGWVRIGDNWRPSTDRIEVC